MEISDLIMAYMLGIMATGFITGMGVPSLRSISWSAYVAVVLWPITVPTSIAIIAGAIVRDMINAKRFGKK